MIFQVLAIIEHRIFIEVLSIYLRKSDSNLQVDSKLEIEASLGL